ncbi:MAG: hypothetical protein WBG08_13130 [Litorimonas sp.]
MDRKSDYGTDDWRAKGARFVQYLTTRDRECWGFFAAGFLIAAILA